MISSRLRSMLAASVVLGACLAGPGALQAAGPASPPAAAGLPRGSGPVPGEAVELAGSASRDEATLREALAEAKRRGVGLRLAPGAVYPLSRGLLIPDEVPFLDGNGATLDVALSGGRPIAVELASRSRDTVVANLVIDLADSPGTKGVYANAAFNPTIRDNRITGLDTHGIEVVAGNGPVEGLRITGNRIEGERGDPKKPGAESIKVSAVSLEPGRPVWKRYAQDGTVSGNRHVNHGAEISGNTIVGGYYGIGLSGVSGGTVSGNLVTDNVRNLSMQNRSSGNTVSGNSFGESVSSGVHIAYDSDGNRVEGNTIVTHRATGQGLLQAYQGSDDNVFADNVVVAAGGARPYWVLYTATDSHGTVFERNIVSAPAGGAVVGIEALWDGRSAAPRAEQGEINRAAYMGSGTITAPDGTLLDYAGGQGPLRNVAVRDNVLLAAGGDAPVVYLGADVSENRGGRARIVGGITGLTVAGNRLAGSEFTETIREHRGVMPGLPSPEIEFAQGGFGTIHRDERIERGGAGDDLLVWDAADDAISGGAGSDTLYASVAEARMPGDVERLRVIARSGVTVHGNASSNVIFGGVGADRIEGGGGEDELHGGQGADELWGGEGADRFVVDPWVFVVQPGVSGAPGEQADRLADFREKGEADRIVLPRVVFGEPGGAWLAAAGAETPETRLVQNGATLSFDPDGSGPEPSRVFATVPDGVQLSATDFELR